MTVSAALSDEPEPLDEWPHAQHLMRPDGVDDRRSLGALRRAEWKARLSVCPCVPRQLSDQDQNARNAPEVALSKAGAWAWRHLRNDKVRGSSPLSSTIAALLEPSPCAMWSTRAASALIPPAASIGRLL
jgi:hypothetical protein